MLSWLTGARMVNNGEEETFIDDTRFEQPETPAPVFAVRAFKQAIFGTPQPAHLIATTRLAKKRKEPEESCSIDSIDSLPAADLDLLRLSPTKSGILLTPGTVRGKKKEVTFGAQVVDNQGKRLTRTGLPTNVSGTVLSPWTTPKQVGSVDDDKPKTKLTEAFYEAKASATTPQHLKGRAKDDADITIDVMEPRSESGRYWKQQYTSYSKRSEEEMKKLIAKQRLARDYARKKDDEASDLRRQLESQSQRNKARENELEQQLKDLRESLRLQLAENAKSTLQITLLKKQNAGKVESISEAVSNTRVVESASSIWIDAGDRRPEDDGIKTKASSQAIMVKSLCEQVPSARDVQGRRLARKDGSICRQDSVVMPIQPPAQQELRFKSQMFQSPTSARRPALADRSANVTNVAPAPAPSFMLLSDIEDMAKPTKHHVREPNQPFSLSPTPREAMADAAASLSQPVQLSICDELAPLAALNLHAEPFFTPRLAHGGVTVKDSPSLRSSKRHKRSEAAIKLSAVPGLDKERAQAARDRIQARKWRRSHVRLR